MNTPTSPAANGASPKGSASAVRNLLDWLETFAYAFCFVLVFFTFLCRIVTVDGSSMSPTLTGEEKYLNQSGDKLLISNLFYTPTYGDIVVVSREDDVPIIKRVIATEGQTVDIDFDNWQVTVDGQLLDEAYINRIDGMAMMKRDVNFPLTVDKGCVFVMGDNRNNSLDSRDSRIGQVKTENIVGRVLCRLLPLGEFGAVEPRAETIAAYERATGKQYAAN